MEDNKEEEDDDNYHNMYPGYDDTAMGVDNEDQEAADGPAVTILVGPLLMQRKNVKLKRRRRSWSRC